jgi:hypothetical protein
LEIDQMPRVYELPTHLEVEDQLIAGLTARQLLRLVIGASLAYGMWDQVPWLPQEVRLALAVVLAAVGFVFALLQPHRRPLDHWLLAAFLFVVLPRRLVWRPEAALLRRPQHEQTGWAELELHPEWLKAEPDRPPEVSEALSGHRRFIRPGTLFPFFLSSSSSSRAGQKQLTRRRWLW